MENSKLYKQSQDHSNAINDSFTELISNSYKMGMAQAYAYVLHTIQHHKFSTEDISKLIYDCMKDDGDIKDYVYEAMKSMDISS